MTEPTLRFWTPPLDPEWNPPIASLLAHGDGDAASVIVNGLAGLVRQRAGDGAAVWTERGAGTDDPRDALLAGDRLVAGIEQRGEPALACFDLGSGARTTVLDAAHADGALWVSEAGLFVASRCFDVVTGEARFPLGAPGAFVRAVARHGSGPCLAFGSLDGTRASMRFHELDPATGAARASFGREGGPDDLEQLFVDGTGAGLAFFAGGVEHIDTASRRVASLAALPAGTHGWGAATCDPSGRYVATLVLAEPGDVRGEVHVRSLADGELVLHVEGTFGALAFDASGTRLALGGDVDVVVVDIAKAEEVAAFDVDEVARGVAGRVPWSEGGGQVSALAWLGTTVFVGGDGGELLAVDLAF